MRFFPAVAALPLLGIALTGCASADANFGGNSTPSFQPTTDSAPADWMNPKECITLFDGDITATGEEPEEVTLDCDETSASFTVNSSSTDKEASNPILSQDVYAQLPGGPGDWHIKDYVSNMQNGKRVYHISYGNSGLKADGTPKSADADAAEGVNSNGSTFCVASSTEGEDSTRVYCSTTGNKDPEPSVRNTLNDDGEVVSTEAKPKKKDEDKNTKPEAASKVAPQSGPVLTY